MLNKLSFNLAKELNESETRNFKIKKRVFMEGTRTREEVLTEDASSAFDRILSGEEVFFRDSEGQPLVVRYSESYPEPEDYDEGYKEEYGGSAEELEAAKQAAEDGEVWEFNEVDEEGKPTGVTVAIIYGTDGLKNMLKDLREVGVTKRLEEGENTFKYSFTPDEIKEILLDNYHDDGDFESEADFEQYLDEELNNIKRIEAESDISMISQPGNDDFPGFKYGKVRTILKDGRTFISEENEVPLISAVELSISKLEEAASMNSNSKEDRLASLKMQLEKDGTQLADDEKKAIEEEIAQLESELQECDKPLKEDDYSLARPWSAALIGYCENFGVDVWEEELRGLINYLPDDTIGKYIKDMNPNGVSKPEDFYPGEMDESALNEKYSEKLGGDSEDFVNDVNVIKSALEAIDTDSFGAKLAQQMVWDWIETCDYQIERGNRLTKGEFNESALNEADGWIAFYNGNKVEITKDEAHDLWSAKQTAIKKLNVPKSKVSLIAVEPAYNESEKSLKEGFKLGESAEIIDTCERRGQPIALVNLSKIKSWEEYVVAFGYTTENDEVSWDYGYYYYDEESAKEAFEKVKAGGNLSESAKVEKKPMVEAAETEVKDLQVIKEQGNVYMLEDKSEGTRYIVGENYNLSEGEIENAEIYENKEEADKDYLNRCEITTTDKSAE